MKSNLILLALISILGTGCVSNSYTDAPPAAGLIYSKYAYIGYEGDIKPINDVGIVTTDGIIVIREVDGVDMRSLRAYKEKGLYSGGRYQLHLEPGQHTLKLGFIENSGGYGYQAWATTYITKEVVVTKGQVLHLQKVNLSGKRWAVREFDGSKDLNKIKSDFESLSIKGLK